MKQLVTVWAFLAIALNGFCHIDTLDHWRVYINDKPVATFNAISKNPTISLKKSEINGNDIITVRYVSDHPCADCRYVLTVPAEMKRKVPETETREHAGKLSIPLRELLDIQKTDGVYRFPFTYREETNQEQGASLRQVHTEGRRLLFVLTII